MTHRLTSDIPVPYFVPASVWENYTFEQTPLPFKQKTKFIALFVSNCRAQVRNRYIQALLEYIQIDSYGQCFRNMSLGATVQRGPEERYPQKYILLKHYKFLLAFENTQEWDYVTEKVYHGLVAGTIPVYLGAPNSDHFLPLHSVINTDNFTSAREIACHLIKLNANHTAYNEYMAWRTGPIGENFRRLQLYGRRTHPVCSLLSRVHHLWINPYLTVWARNCSSDIPSRGLDCIQCLKSYAGPVFPAIYQDDLNPRFV
jgi:hypothetical protein